MARVAGIAFTKKMIDPRPTHNNSFMFQKIYTELDYLAGGILQIPAGGEKPQKPAKDNSYVRSSARSVLRLLTECVVPDVLLHRRSRFGRHSPDRKSVV